MKKRYTNFEEVDKQLEILKLEREIQFRKLGLKLENTSNIVSPSSLMKTGFSTLATTFKGTSSLKSVLLTVLVRFVMKKFTKR
jgi:hypothetical protein